MNSLFTLFIDWQKPKSPMLISSLIKSGMPREKAATVGKGQAEFYLKIGELKKNMKTGQLVRLLDDFNRDMNVLVKKKMNTEDMSDFFAARSGDISRAIKYSVHKYEKTKNADPLKADKDGLKEKRDIDNSLEKFLRKKAY